MDLQDSVLEAESQRLLGRSFDALHPNERTVIIQIIQRGSVARDLAHEQDQALTFGQRLADRVAAVGGSWAFIIGFGIWLAAWIIVNAVILQGLGLKGFDPYPFIFLNLMLSMLAAIQAPLIMMSQNRQSAQDRLAARHDYEVNLKAELEIMSLHEKLDALRDRDLADMMGRQMELLIALKGRTADPGS
jgi:uncharacterized membrane protein